MYNEQQFSPAILINCCLPSTLPKTIGYFYGSMENIDILMECYELNIIIPFYSATKGRLIDVHTLNNVTLLLDIWLYRTVVYHAVNSMVYFIVFTYWHVHCVGQGWVVSSAKQCPLTDAYFFVPWQGAFIRKLPAAQKQST